MDSCLTTMIIREVNILLKRFQILANICPTTRGGNGWTEGSTCKFPFNYRGQMYAPWCYTVDKPTRTTYGVPWGYCSGDSCPGGTLSYSIIHTSNTSGLKHFDLDLASLECVYSINQLATTKVESANVIFRSVRSVKSDRWTTWSNKIPFEFKLFLMTISGTSI